MKTQASTPKVHGTKVKIGNKIISMIKPYIPSYPTTWRGSRWYFDKSFCSNTNKKPFVKRDKIISKYPTICNPFIKINLYWTGSFTWLIFENHVWESYNHYTDENETCSPNLIFHNFCFEEDDWENKGCHDWTTSHHLINWTRNEV